MTVILQDILYKVKCEKITNLVTISKPPRTPNASAAFMR